MTNVFPTYPSYQEKHYHKKAKVARRGFGNDRSAHGGRRDTFPKSLYLCDPENAQARYHAKNAGREILYYDIDIITSAEADRQLRQKNKSFGGKQNKMQKEYIKQNVIPVTIEAVFIISCFLIPKQYYIYTNFCFYMLLLIYFAKRKDFSLKEWGRNLKSTKTFWKQVTITAAFFIAAFVITIVLENSFPDLDTGTIGLKRDTPIKLILFSISTILLPAVTEETFFRKNMIVFSSRNALILTALLSMFLYALEHSLKPWGIFLTMIWALPLSVSYIKTKNIYVPMTAHFIGNLLGNGFDVIISAASFL